MKLSGNTIIITGGSSGLGLEMSRKFIELGNKVIICGRSEQKLAEAKKQLPDIISIQCDLSNQKECGELSEKIKSEHPDFNVLINNAAIVHNTRFTETSNILEIVEAEIQTNFMAPVRLINYMYPFISKNRNPHIINITTGLIYAPRAVYPFYNATKVALHSFTQVLRIQQQKDNVKITEVMFPAVDTPWHKGSPPKIAISTKKAVDGMFAGLKKGKPEIRVGGSKLIYKVARIAPNFALKKINNLTD